MNFNYLIKLTIGLFVFAGTILFILQRAPSRHNTNDDSRFITSTENAKAPEIEKKLDAKAIEAKDSVEQKYSSKIEVEKDAKGEPKGLYGEFRVRRAPQQTNADAMFGFVNEVSPLLNISNPETLKLENEKPAPLGIVTSFVQTINGFKVEGALVQVHQNENGNVIGVDTSFISGISNIPVSPNISDEKAIHLASNFFKLSEDKFVLDKMELAVTKSPVDPSYGLFWKIPVRDLQAGPTGAFIALIDAQTGNVFKKSSVTH